MNFKKILAPAFGKPEVLTVVEEPIPEPGEGEALIKILASGVSFADVMWLSGKVPGGPKPPFIPGYDVVGTIEKVGNGVNGLMAGDQVAALVQYGGYAEYVVVPHKWVVKIPVALDPVRAVSIVLNYMTAYQIYHRVAKVTNNPGTQVLVHGAGGGVGTALLDLGRLFVFEMYGTGSRNKKSIITQLGSKFIDYNSEDFVDSIIKHTGSGVNLVIDPIGGPHFAKSFRVLKKDGILVATASMASVYGMSTFKTIIYYLSVSLWNNLPNGKAATFLDLIGLNEKNPNWYQEDMRQLLQYLSDGKINPIIARTMPLSQAGTAHRLLLDHQIEGKIVLTPG